jgi:hypothetical protein
MKALATLFLIAAGAINMPARALNDACFDDQKLQELQAKHSRGALIYIWSPRMVYSVQNMSSASQAASAAGLQFVALHDARIAENELPSSQKGSLVLCSAQLIRSEALRHFPTAFVITPRAMATHPIVGAMPAGAWTSSIEQRLQQVEQ